MQLRYPPRSTSCSSPQMHSLWTPSSGGSGFFNARLRRAVSRPRVLTGQRRRRRRPAAHLVGSKPEYQPTRRRLRCLRCSIPCLKRCLFHNQEQQTPTKSRVRRGLETSRNHPNIPEKWDGAGNSHPQNQDIPLFWGAFCSTHL